MLPSNILIEEINKIFPLLLSGIWGILTIFLIYPRSRKFGGRRGLYSSLSHLGVLLLGWSYGHWMGMILISVPLLLAYYYLLYHIAIVIVPTSDPENPQEQRKRFRILLWYMWGLQYPLQVVADIAGRRVDTRIPGSPFKKWGAPGLVLAKSHQVAGLTSNIQFSRIEGPGMFFTRRFERIFEVIDLRTQLRTSILDVISKEGIPYQATIFASFAIDNEQWSQDHYQQLSRQNPLLKDAGEPEYKQGSYPFSRKRVRAALGAMGIVSAREDKSGPAIHWDERVLFYVEKAASIVLSQRCIDELWRPRNDREHANALDEIAEEMKAEVAPRLQQWGIRLFACRVVKFEFLENKKNEIVDQQIKSWSAKWESKTNQTLAEGEAEAARLEQAANAYAHSVLLAAVADGLEKTRALNKELPRYVIAMRFIGALEKSVKDSRFSDYFRNWKQRLMMDDSRE